MEAVGKSGVSRGHWVSADHARAGTPRLRPLRVAVAGVAALLVSLLVLALHGQPALAATGHPFVSQLTEANGAAFSEPEGVAVDKAGDVFVANAGAGVVDEFDSTGKFLTEFGGGVLEGELRSLAVDSAGDVYVADSGTDVVDVFKPNGSGGFELLSSWTGAGTPGLAFSEVAGVAVNSSSGKVYVADLGEAVVDTFEAPVGAVEGKFVATLKGGKLEEPTAVAVDSSTGKVYVAQLESVLIFNSAGTFEPKGKLTGAKTPTKELVEVTGVAVDETTHDVLAADNGTKVVQEFGPTNEWVGWLTTAEGGPFGEPREVAVGPSGEVYVVDREKAAVDHFGAGVLVPDVTTGKPSKVKRTGATLNGVVNPDGEATEYHFEYGESESYGSETTVQTATGSSALKITGLATGLKAETLYDVRLVAKNKDGVISYGANVEFITPEAVSGLSSGSASNIETTGATASATLTGSFAPEGFATKYHFEYGETLSYGQDTPVGETSTESSAVANLTGLTPNTTYHFRLVAENSFGVTHGNDATFTTPGPPRIVSKPSEPLSHTSEKLNAEINPDQVNPLNMTKYHFEYGETTAYGTSTTPAELPAGTKAVPVTAEPTGLKLATTYHFRVVAENAGGTTDGPDQQFTTALIDGQSAKEVTSESATLQAQINPCVGTETPCEDTTYHFEYGETAAYGTKAPEPDGDLGAVAGDKSASVHLVGLHPDTTYHYRVVATVGSLGSAGGPDQTFTTVAAGAVAFALPDSRAYEMVSPPNKSGAFIEAQTSNGGAIQAAENGGAFAYVVDGPIVEDPEGNRSPESQQVLSTRASDGWSSQQLVAPHERAWGVRAGRPPEYEAFSSDLSLALMQPFPYGITKYAEPPLSPPLTPVEREEVDGRKKQEKTMYLRENAPITPGAAEASSYAQAKANGETLAAEHGEAEAKPGYLPLVTAANVAPGAAFGGSPIVETTLRVNPDVLIRSATPDLAHVVLSSDVALAPQSPSAPGLYEWGAGKLTLVSVLPSGVPALRSGAGEPDLGFGHENLDADLRHAINETGSRVFWTNDETSAAGLGHLYVTDTAKAPTETLQLDAVQGGPPEAAVGAAHFQTASTDGSKVFFTDTQRLTADSKAAPAEQSKNLPERPDLYECEVVEVSGKLKCQLKDLTVDPNPGESAAVQGLVLGVSDDGSSVYLVATGALAPGAESGADNLYELHQSGTEWTTSFIARLSSEDKPDWALRPGGLAPLIQTSRVSPSGQYLAFMSNARLTGFDNTDVNEETGQHADEEVFLFNSQASSEPLTCVSCNPNHAQPTGVFDTQFSGEGAGLTVDRLETWIDKSNEGTAHWLAGNLPGWTSISVQESLYQSRYLSDSGRLFFNSADPLVAGAQGDTRKETIEGHAASVGVENVYEYEPNGVGGCAKPGGCVALISSGTSQHESAFLDASATGDDVFFLTTSALVSPDQDEALDVYDARVCSEASPCVTPPPPAAHACESSESCRPGSGAPPAFGSPASSTFSGPGNGVAKSGTLPSTVSKPPAPLTKAQKLAAALKKCRKLPKKTRAQKKKRSTCESQAQSKYGAKKKKKPAKKAKKSAHASGGARR